MSSGTPEPAGRRRRERDAAERRRRRTEVFGDALPETTRDDRPDAWGGDPDRGNDDDRLRREVPPHHG